MFNSTQANNPVEVQPYSAEYAIIIRVLAPTWPAIILFGLIANFVNIVVFLKAGAKDSVTVLLLSLAVSDTLFLILITPSMCGYVINTFASPYPYPFDPAILLYLFYWPAYTAYDLSAFISVSLGLMRCACVTLPLKFKSIFTKSRTLKWLVFLFFLAVSLRVPMLTVFRIVHKKDPINNTSVPILTDVNYQQMIRINDILNRGVIMYLLFITMVLCVVVLSYKLCEASKIRTSSTAKITCTNDSQSNSDKPGAQRLSAKDLQVIQSVTLVCVIFILSQLTFVVFSLTRLINPEVDIGKRLSALFGIFLQVGVTCYYLNASLNIFVYYKYNSRFRATFRSMFWEKNEKEQRQIFTTSG